MSKDWMAWIVFVAICFGAAGIGARFTASSVRTWYPALRKPPGTPPSWVFGPVWTTLYLLMGTAAWLVWHQRASYNVRIPLVFFCVQLALNVAWSYIFFGLRLPGMALIEILLLLLAIVLTAMEFAACSAPAFWLLTPYIGWVMYATFLNWGIWRMNRAAV